MLIGLVALCAVSCANDINVTMPKGPKGDSGKSAFELWKEFYGKGSNTTIEDFFEALKGDKGETGEKGLDAYAQWKQGVADGKVFGKDGKIYNGKTELEDYFEWLKGIKGDKGDKGDPGKDGLDAYEQWLEGINAGKVLDKDGEKYQGATTLDDYFIWLVGRDGEAGEPGAEGISAYKEWVLAVGRQEITDKDGEIYVGGVTLADFFEWLKGRDGNDGVDGINGQPGAEGISAYKEWVSSVNNGDIKNRDGSIYIGETSLSDFFEWLKGQDGLNGQDGKDGDSSFKLWQDAVNDGSMTNKDGSEYTGGNTWEDYLRWLQGGDASVLFLYWQKLPGNNDKTIEDFITELFDCHCNQVDVVVTSTQNCLNIDENGEIRGIYEAELILMGTAGTAVTIKDENDKILFNKTLGDNDVTFKIEQKKEIQLLNLSYIAPKKKVAKEKVIRIPAIKAANVKTEIVDIDGSSSKVTLIVGDSENIQTIAVDGKKIKDGVDGWKKVANGYEKIFDKGAKDLNIAVEVEAKERDCTYFYFVISSLEKLETPAVEFENSDDCSYKIIVKGEKGLTINAWGDIIGKSNPMVETSDGVYELMLDKQLKNSSITLDVSKKGYGSISFKISMPAYTVMPKPYKSKVIENQAYSSKYIVRYTNVVDKEITLSLSRSLNTQSASLSRDPWVENNQIVYKLQPNESVDITLYKDYTVDFKSGRYSVTINVTNSCGKEIANYENVPNQTNYKYGFRPMNDGNDGGENGSILEPGEVLNPDGSVTTVDGKKIWKFLFTMEDGLPRKYTQLQLNLAGNLMTALFNEQLDDKGHLSKVVSLSDADYQSALQSGVGNIIFSNDILSKEKLHTSEIDFKFD